MPHHNWEAKETCRRIDVKKKGILLAGMIALFCIFFAGCNTMLNRDLTVEYVPDTRDNDNTQEDFTLVDVTTDDMVPKIEKYKSSYPNAFAFKAGHSTDPEDLISFEVLEFTDDNTFVYAYQTIDKTSSTEDKKVMASVLMSYNYQTKEKKVIWELTSSVTDSKSLFTQPIYLNGSKPKSHINYWFIGNNYLDLDEPIDVLPQCIGYLAYFNGQIFVFRKEDNKVLFAKDISSNLKQFYEERRDKKYNSGSYEITEITADGDYRTRLNIHMKMSILSKNMDEVLDGEPVPSVTYAPSEENKEEDTDVDEATYGIKNYTVLYTITYLEKTSFTAKNNNYDNQVRNWTSNGDTGGFGDVFDECIMDNGWKLVEEHNSTWVTPWCASGNQDEVRNFSNYSHKLKDNRRDYYEIYATIESTNRHYGTATRTVTTKNEKGEEKKYTEQAQFLYSITFTFADGLYGISCTFIDEDASYSYLYGNYIIKYQKNLLYILKSAYPGTQQDEIYKNIYKRFMNNEITLAEGVLLNGQMYIFVTDERYLYLYDMEGNLKFNILSTKLNFPKTNEGVTVTPTPGGNIDFIKVINGEATKTQTPQGSAENSDIYRADCISLIDGQYYISSIYSGLSTVYKLLGSYFFVRQVSTYTCYGIYPQGSSYYVLGFDNNEPVYTLNDMIHAKLIPLNQFCTK